MITFKVEAGTLKAHGEWPKTETQALATSIRKWKAIAQHVKLHERKVEWGVQDKTCALCQLYVIPTGYCDGCPVAEAGHEGCYGTPFADYEDATDWRIAYAQARAEVAFLETLRK